MKKKNVNSFAPIYVIAITILAIVFTVLDPFYGIKITFYEVSLYQIIWIGWFLMMIVLMASKQKIKDHDKKQSARNHFRSE